MKYLVYIFLAVTLASCSTLEHKVSQIEIGSSKKDVMTIMGAPPYQYTIEGVDAWRYAVIAYIGACEYQEIYLYRDQVIHLNTYTKGSSFGCTIGLRDINWDLILAKAKEWDETHPPEENPSLVQELKELNGLKNSGALTEEEYSRAKEQILNKQ